MHQLEPIKRPRWEKFAQIARDKIISLRITHWRLIESPTTMTQVVTVTYDLVVPDGTHRPKPESSTSHTRPVAPSASGHKEYYDALRVAIDEIKEVTGHELTAWRDAVGSGELGKEASVKKEDDEDGSEGGDGEK